MLCFVHFKQNLYVWKIQVQILVQLKQLFVQVTIRCVQKREANQHYCCWKVYNFVNHILKFLEVHKFLPTQLSMLQSGLTATVQIFLQYNLRIILPEKIAFVNRTSSMIFTASLTYFYILNFGKINTTFMLCTKRSNFWTAKTKFILDQYMNTTVKNSV